MTFADTAATQLCSLLDIDQRSAASLVADALDAVGTGRSWSTDDEKMNAVVEVAVSAHFARTSAAATAVGTRTTVQPSTSTVKQSQPWSASAASSSSSPTSPAPTKKRPRQSPSSSSMQQKTIGSYFALPQGKSIKTQRTLASCTIPKAQTSGGSGVDGVAKREDTDIEVNIDDVVVIMDDVDEDNVKQEADGDIEPIKEEEQSSRSSTQEEELKVDARRTCNRNDLGTACIKSEPSIMKKELNIAALQNIPVDYSSKDFDAKALAEAYISSGCSSPPFIHLAKALTLVSSTTKRLEKERVLTNLLLSLLYYDRTRGIEWNEEQLKSGTVLFPDCSVLHAVLLSGNVASNGLLLNIGHSAISQAICSALSCSSTKLRQAASAAGEMGDAAADIFLGRDVGGSSSGEATVAVKQTRLTWGAPPKPLCFEDIVNTIADLHALSKGGGGKGVEGKRKDALYKVLSRCKEPEEVRFSVKIFCEHIRTGATLITLLRCLSSAHVLHEHGLKNAVWRGVESNREEIGFDSQTIQRAQETFRSTYACHHKLKECILSLAKYGMEGMSDRCGVEVFCPIQPMLAAPSRGIDDVMKHYTEHYESDLLGDNKKSNEVAKGMASSVVFLTAEYKYDGQRAQIHCRYNQERNMVEVEIFSRHLDDMTEKFGQLVLWMKKNWRADDPTSFILDAEIVAVKRENDEVVLLPFQILSTMKRRSEETTPRESNSEGDAVDVCIFAFDLMFINGESLVSRTLAERRTILREKLGRMFTPGYFEFAKSIDVSLSGEEEGNKSARAEIEKFLAESIGPNGRCEGLMLKSLLSLYTSHESREKSGGFGGWRKLKKDYVDDLADSIDVVPIGAWRGSGRKSKWFSPFLVAVYEATTGEFQSLCRVMSGFSDSFYQEKFSYYSKRIVDEMPDNVSTGENAPFWFEPCEVWEIRGADLTISPVHHAALGRLEGADEMLDADNDGGRGISLRFPRFVRTREDKKIEEATTSSQLLALFSGQAQRRER